MPKNLQGGYVLESDSELAAYVEEKGKEETFNFNYTFDTLGLCPFPLQFGQNYEVSRGGKHLLKKLTSGIITIHVPLIILTHGVYEVVFHIDKYISEELQIGVMSLKGSIHNCWLKYSPEAFSFEFTKTGAVVRVLLDLEENQVLFHEDGKLVEIKALPTEGGKRKYLLGVAARSIGTEVSVISSAWGPSVHALGLSWRKKLYTPAMLSKLTDILILQQ